MDNDEDFFEIIEQLRKKYRDLAIMLAVVAFLLGLFVGSVWMYYSIDRVTIVSTAPQIKV